MNKTIIININGIIFHIEEEAYEVLQAYMVEVKKHFGHSIDSQEIVGDIENRIAEMFSERLNDQKAVILMEDVKEVCAQMGKVEDFEIGDETTDEFTQEPIYSYREERSLFRDPDDKVFGGVCSGLGHYFEVESRWVRLIFLIIFFFGGTGLLIYAILWIVVPIAKTRADKMKMRGEPANLENFKRSFQEEMGDVKENFSKAGGKVKSNLSDPNSNTNAFINTTGKVLLGIIKIFGMLIIISLSLSLVGITVSLFLGANLWNSLGIIPLELVDFQSRNALLTALFLTLVIPILVLIFLIIRVLFNRKVMNTPFGVTLLIVWLMAIGFSFFYISKMAISFINEPNIIQNSYQSETSHKLTILGIPFSYSTIGKTNIALVKRLTPQSTFRLHLLDDNTIPSLEKESNLDSKKSRYQSKISLHIEQLDENKQPILEQYIIGEKRLKRKKIKRNGNITYPIKQEGENLWFPMSLRLPEHESIDDFKVVVKLFIPIGTRLIISKDLEEIIDFRSSSILECKTVQQNRNSANETEWQMTETGLKCLPSNVHSQNRADSLSIDSSSITAP